MRTERGAGTGNRAETVELQAHHFCKKVAKSREIYNFTAFCGGPNRDRTDDLTDANRTLSQGGKFSAHGLRCMV